MSIDELRKHLELLREFGVERWKSGDQEFHFSARLGPNTEVTVPEKDPQERLARIKREFKEATNDAAEEELWSAT